MMKETATIKFQDLDSSDEAVMIVRHDESRIALCLSLKSDGDVQVVMERTHARKLVEALKEAISGG